MMMMMSCVGAAFFKEKKKEKKVEINPHTSQKENFFVGSIIFLHLCMQGKNSQCLVIKKKIK